MEEFDEGYQTKEQVPTSVPKRIKSLHFGLLSPQDILSQSVLSVTDRNLYDIGAKRSITKHGPNDERLGTSAKSGVCATCGRGLKDCNGHFGHVKLVLPCFHYGYLKKIVEVLSCVCKDCSRILMPEQQRRAALHAVRKPGLDSLRKKTMCKKLADGCRKVKICPYCSGYNGPVSRVAHHPVKMVHHKFAIYTSSNAKNKQKPAEMVQFESSLEEAKSSSTDIERHVKKALDDMHPLRVLNIFKKIPAMDIEILGMDPHARGGGGRPENMLWTHVPAPPVCIRPSVAQESASTEDDITNKLGDIVQMNNIIKATLTRGQPLSKVMELWEFLQIQVAMYIDGNLPGLGKESQFGRTMRGFCQRLKGKQGRFRGNLSGKRVDFSGRTVISPDPNLGIDEVAVPSRVAMVMTYPEKVTRYNIEKLKKCVVRGPNVHPGANFVVKSATDNRRVVLRVVGQKGDLHKIADRLMVGDTVERHLEDGDIVLFNRQPSLHKLSILSHRVKVRPWRTFRLNECVCNPYNADFDGDEMNLHVPQTEQARTEASELMGVKHNLATPKNGAMIIAAIQDFITAAYLLTQKDRFFSRAEFTQVISYMFGGMEVKDPYSGEKWPVDIPHPAVVRPRALWTGKQVWNVLMKPCRRYPVVLNLEAKGKQFRLPNVNDVYDLTTELGPENAARKKERKKIMKEKGFTETSAAQKVENKQRRATGSVEPEMTPSDTYLVVHNSELMCGTLDKANIGDGKKDSVFYVILRDFGPEYAAEAMNRLARFSARWLGEQGFSIGIGDVYPSALLREKKDHLVKEAYEKCVDLIQLFNQGKLERSAGCDEEATLEQKISKILSAVREACGHACFAELSRFNAPLTMAKCGSKGSNINVSQMVATVGQQIISGERVVDGFENRTLPHFVKGSRDPPAKGFVVNSFFSGLNPTEFIFHAMSGREGLVDTAVKTAETGYMSRRLMKSMEDVSTRYDGTVRESAGNVVQMVFGDDGLDPVDMEGSAKPVNFERSFSHAVAYTLDDQEPGLLQDEIRMVVQETLGKERKKLGRAKRDGITPDYNDQSDAFIDQLESARDFLDQVEEFIDAQAQRLMSNQQRLEGTEKIFKLTRTALDTFLQLCLRKFEKSKTEAGHAVGAVGAQSIGEPGTQMTLKTFHFAGVAGMNLTQGVPRIKEIINASKTISTPLITCVLESPYEELAARFAKAVIQKTYLEDIVDYIDDFWTIDDYAVRMKVDWQQVERLGLRISLDEVVSAIEHSKLLRGLDVSARAFGTSHIHLKVGDSGVMELDDKGRKKKKSKKKSAAMVEPGAVFETVQVIKRRLPQVVVKGYPEASRAVMKKADKEDAFGRSAIDVLVEGYGFKACMNTPGVRGTKTTTNSVVETKEVLGIEAARSTIVAEISAVMSGMDIDPRHMQLLADVMTYKGEVLGITRFGLAKMRDSVLQLASFEKTPDHLFEAAIGGKKDEIQGVSECIIMGQSVGLGTGAMRVFRPLKVDGERVKVDSCTSGVRKGWKGAAKKRKGKSRNLRADLRADMEV